MNKRYGQPLCEWYIHTSKTATEVVTIYRPIPGVGELDVDEFIVVAQNLGPNEYQQVWTFYNFNAALNKASTYCGWGEWKPADSPNDDK